LKTGEEMRTKICYLALIAFILVSCQTTSTTPKVTPSSILSPTEVATFEQTVTPEITRTLPITATLSPTTEISPTADPVPPTIAPIVQPIIVSHPGMLYEKVFTIPEGGDSVIKYFRGAEGVVNGPNAIAVLSDDSFLIADPVGNQLLHFDPTGQLLNVITLGDLGIKTIIDMRVKENNLFLLEASYEKYRVHRLTLDGVLIASEEIPHRFPLDKDLALESSLTGIAIDCEGNIILEVKGGTELYPLSWIQNHSDLAGITQGYLCSNKRYWISSLVPPQISAGDINYETRLTTKFGHLYILDIFRDGTIYIVRYDLLSEQPGSQRDQTIHYFGTGGAIQGVARITRSEFYYSVMRSMAIGPNGEVFVLLPKPDSIDIIRLNFYTELEPLIPDAAIPQITISPNSP
jgi:hypothetical protein